MGTEPSISPSPSSAVLSVSELEGKGRRNPASSHRSPAPNDVACDRDPGAPMAEERGPVFVSSLQKHMISIVHLTCKNQMKVVTE